MMEGGSEKCKQWRGVYSKRNDGYAWLSVKVWRR